MECGHATPDPATITLDDSRPAVHWRGSGVNESNENTTVFKMGEHDEEVDLPIGVMTMKHRTVRVALHQVVSVVLGTLPGENYCIIEGDRTSNIIPERHRTLDDVIHTIAHEVGHLIVGGGHPDEEGGDAPLSGTDRTKRLMCSGPNWNGNSLLLVKQEWDKAEMWLSARPNGDN